MFVSAPDWRSGRTRPAWNLREWPQHRFYHQTRCSLSPLLSVGSVPSFVGGGRRAQVAESSFLCASSPSLRLPLALDRKGSGPAGGPMGHVIQAPRQESLFSLFRRAANLRRWRHTAGEVAPRPVSCCRSPPHARHMHLSRKFVVRPRSAQVRPTSVQI